MALKNDDSRLYTYYVCYNQISYIVACEHALRADPSRTTVLIDTSRVFSQPRYTHVIAHSSLANKRVALACLFSLVRPTALYVPHRRFGWLLRALSTLADRLGLLDDGLDTLREQPKNVELGLLADFSEFVTFENYEPLASWTRLLPIRRVCHFSRLLEDVRPALRAGSARALIVQSPGIQLASAASALGIEPHEALVLIHGNPKKRGDVPTGFKCLNANEYSVEKTVAEFSGMILTGETMVTVVALHFSRGTGIVVALTNQQFANLKCLHARLVDSGVRFWLTSNP